MDKIAMFKNKEIARKKAINPKIEDKFNTEELQAFYNNISKTISYDNSEKIEFYCFYQTITESI